MTTLPLRPPAFASPAVEPPAVPVAVRATLLASSMMTVMAGAVVAAAIPLIRDTFGDEQRAKLVLALPAAAIASFALMSGWFADRVGRKPLLVGGLALYVVAGSSGLYVETLNQLLAGRLLLGVAVAMVMTANTTLVSDYFAGPARPRFLGLQAAFMSLGGVIFIPLGGLLAQGGWHAPFWVYALALPVLLLAILAIREPDRREVQHGPTPGADEPTRVRWPVVFGLYAVGFVGMTAFYLGPIEVPFLMGERFGLDPFRSSLPLAAATVAGACVSSQYGKIARRAPAAWILTAMFTLVGLGYSLVGLTHTLPMALAGLVLSGFGTGLMIPTLSTWLLRVSPPPVRGRLSGGLITAIFAGQVVSPFVVGVLKSAGGADAVFGAVGGTMLLVGVGFAVALRSRYKAHG